jgi:hypothetical protein
MTLADPESVALSRARAAHKSWLVLRYALVLIAVASLALCLYLAGAVEFVGNPLKNYLVGLLLLVGVGATSYLLSGWFDSRTKLLIELLEAKSEEST